MRSGRLDKPIGGVRRAVMIAVIGACAPQPSPRAPDSPEPFARKESMTFDCAVEGVEIATEPVSLAAWAIAVKNKTDDNLQVLWDESSFVGSAGRSHGRLVRGATRKIDTAKVQPASPLPPKATVTEMVVPEDFAQELEAEEHVDVETDEVTTRRSRVLEELNHGRLYVVVQTPVGKHTCTGTIEENGRTRARADNALAPAATDPADDPAKTSSYWCPATAGRCSADQVRCKNRCTPTKTVWCAVHTTGAGDVFDCASSWTACLELAEQGRYEHGECVKQTARR